MRLLSLLLAVIFLFMTSACTDAYDEATLAGTWQLDKYRFLVTGSVGHEPDVIPRRITITLEDDTETGTITGQSLEHDVAGTYNLFGENQITVTSLTTTGEDENDWGKKFVGAMEVVEYYEYKNADKLYLYYRNGNERMEFVRE